jgi:capsular polysaccharide biosynthesis protein
VGVGGRPAGAALLLTASELIYGALLALYPRAFRERYAEEMRRNFANLSREGLEEGGGTKLVRVWGGAFSDLALTALQERGTAMSRSAFLPVEPSVTARALVAVVLVAVTVAATSLVKTPQYEASSKVLIDKQGSESHAPEMGVLQRQQLTLTLAEATRSRLIAEETIERLELSTTPDAFLERLKAEPIENTQFIELSYTDSNPHRARVVTNTVGEVLSRRVSEVGSNVGDVNATLWERAPIPEEPVSPTPCATGSSRW